MDLGLKGKRALVLGGGRGIGRGIAEALAAEGADVAIASRNLAVLEEAAAAMGRHGGKTLAVSADLNERGAVGEIYERVAAAFGGIDVLVNNTGGPPPGGVVGVTEEQWSKQFEAMVLSVISLTNLALPGMRERKWGRVLTVASSGVVQPAAPIGISNTLRSALVGWSKTLAGEVARDGVTVNLLLPATTRTQRIAGFWEADAARTGRSIEQVETAAAAALPMGRYGTIEEFGAVAAFIASVPASYVTGSMIRIDGGYIASI